jgi:hypothetical protein
MQPILYHTLFKIGGFESWQGQEIFVLLQDGLTGSDAHPASCSVCTEDAFRGEQSGRGVRWTTHPLYAYMASTGTTLPVSFNVTTALSRVVSVHLYWSLFRKEWRVPGVLLRNAARPGYKATSTFLCGYLPKKNSLSIRAYMVNSS